MTRSTDVRPAAGPHRRKFFSLSVAALAVCLICVRYNLSVTIADSGFSDEPLVPLEAPLPGANATDGFDDSFDESVADEPPAAAEALMQTASLSGTLPVMPAARVTNGPDVIEGRFALLMNLLLLEKGLEELAAIPCYTATFFKQERLNAELGQGQIIQLKMRHAPFSVYMHWHTGDEGREVLYIEGQNDGDMIAHPGGWKGRILPSIKLNPRGAIAMQESRHPVTEVGLMKLAQLGIEICKRNLGYDSGVSCRMVDGQTFDERPCYVVVIEHETPQTSPDYRKLVVYIDQKLSVPIAVRNYAWPTAAQQQLSAAELDEATLSENYSYANIRLDPQLADSDFDRNNESYSFRR